MKELQEDIDRLKRDRQLSNNRVYRSYLSDLRFEFPKNLPNARSLIVMAISDTLMLVNFHLDGRKHEIMLPPQYYATGLTNEILCNRIFSEIIREPGYKLEKAETHLKMVAVRSGLGRYGRNNLCYVEGMGSLIKLFAYFTDYEFEENSWIELKMMDRCKNCNICIEKCPTKCISGKKFVIDAGRCLSLYNEAKGEFPKWISPDAHNALIGCMRCQLDCPANLEAIKQVGRLEDITEEETKRILKGTPDKQLLGSLSKKLRKFGPCSEEFFPIFTRNLKAVLHEDQP